MTKEKLVQIFQSKNFKRFTIFLGITFVILTFFISVDPTPFLQFGYFGVFIFNIFGAGTLLIPSLARHMNIFLLAFFSSLGMAGNDSISWLIGSTSGSLTKRSEKLRKIENSIRKFGVFALFFWSLIPFPYDLVGFVAGYLGMPYVRYIIPTFLGKFIRLISIGLGVISLF
jgi:membrane protein DedA with SNARE-associated domain